MLTKHHDGFVVWKEIQVSFSNWPETRWYRGRRILEDTKYINKFSAFAGLDSFDVVFVVDTEVRQKFSQLCKTKKCVCSTKHCLTLTRKKEIEKLFIHAGLFHMS